MTSIKSRLHQDNTLIQGSQWESLSEVNSILEASEPEEDELEFIAIDDSSNLADAMTAAFTHNEMLSHPTPVKTSVKKYQKSKQSRVSISPQPVADIISWSSSPQRPSPQHIPATVDEAPLLLLDMPLDDYGMMNAMEVNLIPMQREMEKEMVNKKERVPTNTVTFLEPAKSSTEMYLERVDAWFGKESMRVIEKVVKIPIQHHQIPKHLRAPNRDQDVKSYTSRSESENEAENREVEPSIDGPASKIESQFNHNTKRKVHSLESDSAEEVIAKVVELLKIILRIVKGKNVMQREEMISAKEGLEGFLDSASMMPAGDWETIVDSPAVRQLFQSLRHLVEIPTSTIPFNDEHRLIFVSKRILKLADQATQVSRD